MGLSDKDNHAFESIIAGLKDVETSAKKTVEKTSVSKILLGSILMLLGFAGLIFGVYLQMVFVGLIAFIVLLVAAFTFMDGWVKKTKIQQPSTVKLTIRERYRAFITELEEKDRERFGRED